MGCKLIYKLKSFEGFRFAFVEALWGGCPYYGVGVLVVLDSFSTGSTSDNILTQGLITRVYNLYQEEMSSPLGDLECLNEAGKIILNRTELMLPNLLSCREVLKNTY